MSIRGPSLYKHFAGKRELYVAVLRRLLDPYFVLLGQLLDVPRDAADAERNLVAVVTHYLQTPNLARLVQHAALAGGDELELLVAQLVRPALRPRHRSARGPRRRCAAPRNRRRSRWSSPSTR